LAASPPLLYSFWISIFVSAPCYSIEQYNYSIIFCSVKPEPVGARSPPKGGPNGALNWWSGSRLFVLELSAPPLLHHAKKKRDTGRRVSARDNESKGQLSLQHLDRHESSERQKKHLLCSWKIEKGTRMHARQSARASRKKKHSARAQGKFHKGPSLGPV